VRRLPVLNSITWRITLGFSVLAGVIFLSVALVIHAAAAHHFEGQDRQAWEGKLELIGHILHDWHSVDDAAAVHELLDDAMVGHHSLLVRVEDPHSGFRFLSGHARIPALTADTLPTREQDRAFMPVAWTGDRASFRGMAALVATGQPGHAMQVTVASDTSRYTQILTTFDYQLAMICGAALLVMAWLAWLTTRRGLAPIGAMAHVAESISAHHLQERLATAQVPVELRPLAEAFNGMLDRLSDSLQRLTDFSSDLAHELRTPISNLMMQTQVSLSNPRTADEYREVLYSSLEEYEHLARMIGDMLFLAKADHGLIIPHRETILLEEEVSALFEFYEALAAERGVRLARGGDGVIHGDRVMVRRAIGNLLANAIRFTPRTGEIRVDLTASQDHVAVCVANPGTTIPPEQMSRLFNRFYRGSPSRQRVEEGAGLGLAICQSIVRAHGGDVSVVSLAGMTRFVMTFPREPTAPVTPGG
jgi:two-component system heavy metal sensor histidine kinase CusS